MATENLVFTNYELEIIREILIDAYDSWEDRVLNEEVSERVIKTMAKLIDTLDRQLGYMDK